MIGRCPTVAAYARKVRDLGSVQHQAAAAPPGAVPKARANGDTGWRLLVLKWRM